MARSWSRSAIRAALVLAAVAGATASVTVGAAVAAPASRCATDARSTSTGSAVCYGATRQYRVTVLCQDPLRGSDGTFYGPYVGSGKVSSRKCPYQGNVQWQVESVNVQFR